MSTIALFGGTGRTGEKLIERLLAEGHVIRLLARRAVHRDGITTIVGDATNQEDVRETVQGADVVFSALGTDRQHVLSRFTPIVIDAMQQEGIARIITVGTAGILRAQSSDAYRFETRESKRTMTTAAEDHAAAFELLDASNLDFTIVCPTQLVDEPVEGKVWVTEDVLGTVDSGKIARDDVAKLVIEAWQDKRFIRHRVGITTES